MRQAGHHATGLAGGTLVAGAVHLLHPGIPLVDLIAIGGAGWFGGVAPDHLEYLPFVRIPWVPHRTLTHWGVLWVAGLATSLYVFVHAPTVVPATVLGFAFGGCLHLLFDWPNPTGVPWILPVPSWRHSLHLWRSGEHDLALSITMITAALVPWVAIKLFT